MTTATKQIVTMLEMLPEIEQQFACEVMKKLVLAWDPDYTKLTPDEAKSLDEAHKQCERGEWFREEDIDWDNLDSMDLD